MTHRAASTGTDADEAGAAAEPELHSSTSGRPALHLTPTEGWVNDPLALTWVDDRYHLFLQHVPGSPQWAPECRWAHVTSTDLLHWQERPVALEPGDGDGGCWSGCVVTGERAEDAVMFYTAVDVDEVEIGRVRVARPVDATWDTWTKGEVVVRKPPGYQAVAYRDPQVLHDGTAWRMLMGAGRPDGTATVLVHSSADLRSWTYDGELASRGGDERDPVWTGTVWECPQLFPLDGRWVLTVSVWEPGVPHYEAWAVGDYADGRFRARTWGRLSHGPSYYAASTYTDADGRRGLVYWLRGVDDAEGVWASATSLPHVLRIAGDRVVADAHPALAGARTGSRTAGAGERVPSAGLADIEWELPPSGGSVLDVRDAGRPVVTFAATYLGTGRARAAVTVDGHSWDLPLSGSRLRVVVDGPVLEVFGPGGVLAAPLRLSTDADVEVSTSAGRLTVHSLDGRPPRS